MPSSTVKSGTTPHAAGAISGVRRLSALTAVASATYTDTLRQPIYTAIQIATLFLLASSPALASFTFGSDELLLADITLNTVLLSGVVVSAFTASQTISVDLRTRTALAVLAKPVGRVAYIVGKFTGITSATLLASWNALALALLVMRIGVQKTAVDPLHEPAIAFGFASIVIALALGGMQHYRRGIAFGQTFTLTLALLLPIAAFGAQLLGPTWAWDPQAPSGDFCRAGLLLLGCFVIAVAVTLVIATRIPAVPTLFISLAVLSFGLTSSYFFGDLAESSAIARALYAIVPNLQYLWVGDQLIAGEPVSVGYVFEALVYALVYSAAAISVAVGSFASRNIG